MANGNKRKINPHNELKNNIENFKNVITHIDDDFKLELYKVMVHLLTINNPKQLSNREIENVNVKILELKDSLDVFIDVYNRNIGYMIRKIKEKKYKD